MERMALAVEALKAFVYIISAVASMASEHLSCQLQDTIAAIINKHHNHMPSIFFKRRGFEVVLFIS